MKRIVLLLSTGILLSTVLSVFTYKLYSAKSDMTKSDFVVKEKSDKIIDSMIARNQNIKTEDSIETGTGSDKITNDTKIIMEYFDANTERTTYENMESYPALLGLTRAGVSAYVERYMKSMNQEDADKGLYQFELISFSVKEVILRKSYLTEKKDEPAYYVAIKDYMIIVYNNPERTVYEETDIDSRLLPEKVQAELSRGMYFTEDYDLYNFLEACTS